MNWILLKKLAEEAGFKFSRRMSIYSTMTQEDLVMEIITRAAQKNSQPAFSTALANEDIPALRVALGNIATEVVSEWNSEVTTPEGGVMWGVDSVREALYGGGSGDKSIIEVLDSLSPRHATVLRLAAVESREYACGVLGVSPSTFSKMITRAVRALNHARPEVSRCIPIHTEYEERHS